MKLTWGLALSSLYSAACAAGVGHVYIHDVQPRKSPQASTSVDPETARLILAQRLGISQFHSVKNPTTETIEQINAYSGRPRKLFGSEEVESTQAQLLVWLEDVEDITEVVKDSSRWTTSFTIPAPPSAADNDRLVADMAQQASSLPKKADPKGNTYAAVTAMDTLLQHIPHHISNDYLTIVRAEGTRTPLLAEAIEELRSKGDGQHGYSITLVVMPPSSSHTKRTPSSWGKYLMPSTMQARREPTEAPLSASTVKAVTSSNSVVSDLEDFPVITQAKGNTTAPLGILPACFSSQSECEKRTNGCSGHGGCEIRRKGGQGRTDCFGCKCDFTEEHTGENGMESKIKRTYWGGPACQKKDVSVPFWLFVGSGLMLAFLVSTGIGMLYSMGSEELPSVIGAGVSGPVRK